MSKSVRHTVASVAIRRVGFRKAFGVLSFSIEWGMVANALGREDFTVDEFAKWWAVSRAQGFRRQQRWRECFPEYSSPLELIAAARFVVPPNASPESLVTDFALCELVFA